MIGRDWYAFLFQARERKLVPSSSDVFHCRRGLRRGVNGLPPNVVETTKGEEKPTLDVGEHIATGGQGAFVALGPEKKPMMLYYI